MSRSNRRRRMHFNYSLFYYSLASPCWLVNTHSSSCLAFSSAVRGLISSVDSEKLEWPVLAAWAWTSISDLNNLPHLQYTTVSNYIINNHILDLCELPRLTFWDDRIKIPHASHRILEINYEPPPCSNEFHQINWETTPYPSPWLSTYPIGLVLPDTDLTLQFCLPYALKTG